MAPLESIEYRRIDDGSVMVTAINEQGEVIGFAIGTRVGDTLQVDSVHVIPPERRTGVGTQMMDTLENSPVGAGATKICGRLGCEEPAAATNFWRKRGLTVDEERNITGEKS